jgi:hypothetical protein
VLSIPISKKAGETRRAFNNFNLNNLPDPKHNDPAKDDKDSNPILGPINVLDFIFDEKEKVADNAPFNWYRYSGSITQPPCAENTVWIVVDTEILLSTTVVTLFRDALTDPDASGLVFNYGNNRLLQPPNNRTVEYYNMYKGESPPPNYPE